MSTLVGLRCSLVWVAAALVLSLVLAGCKPKEAEEIRSVQDAFNRAIQNADANGAISLLNRVSIEEYARWRDLAFNATPEQTRKMRPVDFANVLALRVRGTRAELEGLDARGVAHHSISRGWFARSDPPDPVRVAELKLYDGAAEARLVYGRGINAWTMWSGYVFEDGGWKIDLTTAIASSENQIDAYAQRRGMTAQKLFIEWLEIDLGEAIDERIAYNPMK